MLNDIELPILLSTITTGTTAELSYKKKYSTAPIEERVWARINVFEVFSFLTISPEHKYESKSAIEK